MTQKKRAFKIEEVYDIRMSYTFGGFELELKGQTPGGAPAKVKAEFHFCEAQALATELWRMVKQREDKINQVKRALKGETQ